MRINIFTTLGMQCDLRYHSVEVNSKNVGNDKGRAAAKAKAANFIVIDLADVAGEAKRMEGRSQRRYL